MRFVDFDYNLWPDLLYNFSAKHIFIFLNQSTKINNREFDQNTIKNSMSLVTFEAHYILVQSQVHQKTPAYLYPIQNWSVHSPIDIFQSLFIETQLIIRKIINGRDNTNVASFVAGCKREEKTRSAQNPAGRIKSRCWGWTVK